MKKLKKGEIAIYIIAIMLVTAGYFNYENFNKNIENTYSSDLTSEVNKTGNIGDAVLVSSQDVQEKNENNELNTENAQKEKIDDNSEDYYVSSKLERNKMYAEMITNYENILNNTNSSEVQKSIAVEEIKLHSLNKLYIITSNKYMLMQSIRIEIHLTTEWNLIFLFQNIRRQLNQEHGFGILRK